MLAPNATLRTQLLKRVLGITLARRLHCGGPLTLSAAIDDPTVIVKIFTHLGLRTSPTPFFCASIRSLSDGLIPNKTRFYLLQSGSLPPEPTIPLGLTHLKRHTVSQSLAERPGKAILVGDIPNFLNR